MLNLRSIRGLSLSLFALNGALAGFDAAPAWAADKLKCNKCVDTKDVANRAISRKKIKPGAVDGTRLRDGAVTPAKWAFRLFDAGNRVVGQLDPDGRVLLQAVGGVHAGKWFTLGSRRANLLGGSLFYTMDNCMGQAYLQIAPSGRVPIRAGVGADPALGAVAGDPVRLVIFLPNDPAAPPATNVAIESRAGADPSGKVTCSDASFPLNQGFLADVIDSPDIGSFSPPFRAGVQ